MVDLDIDLGNGSTIDRIGEITYVGSEIDPVNNEVRFWVEFDNPGHEVLPGMRLRLSSPSSAAADESLGVEPAGGEAS